MTIKALSKFNINENKESHSTLGELARVSRTGSEGLGLGTAYSRVRIRRRDLN